MSIKVAAFTVSEKYLNTKWIAKKPLYHHADSEHSEQTGRI